MKIVKIPEKNEEIVQFFRTGISLHNARESCKKYFHIGGGAELQAKSHFRRKGSQIEFPNPEKRIVITQNFTFETSCYKIHQYFCNVSSSKI